MAAAAAAEAARLRNQEEEEMTPYNEKELAEGWEFKILRSNMNAFRKRRISKGIWKRQGRPDGYWWKNSTTIAFDSKGLQAAVV